MDCFGKSKSKKKLLTLKLSRSSFHTVLLRHDLADISSIKEQLKGRVGPEPPRIPSAARKSSRETLLLSDKPWKCRSISGRGAVSWR